MKTATGNPISCPIASVRRGVPKPRQMFRSSCSTVSGARGGGLGGVAAEIPTYRGAGAVFGTKMTRLECVGADAVSTMGRR